MTNHSELISGNAVTIFFTMSKLGWLRPFNIWVNPDCGLKTRGERETIESLRNLVTAADVLRKEK